MNIFFRVDGCYIIGYGHIMRCLTLASHILNKNKDCYIYFITKYKSKLFDKYLEKYEKFNIHYLKINPKYNIKLSNTSTWLGDDIETDCNQCKQIISNVNKNNKNNKNNILIIDHYGIDYKWEKNMKSIIHFNKLIVLDDLYNRKHDCDYLINNNYQETIVKNSPYVLNSLVTKKCKLLIGSKYCFLNSVFPETPNLSQKNGKIKRINISFGGSDIHNMSEKILDFFIKSQILKKYNIQCDIILGSLHKSSKYKTYSNNILKNNNIKIYNGISITKMAKLLSKTELCIGATGTSQWERCYYGIPTLVITVAENQIYTAKKLHIDKIIRYMGHYTDYSDVQIEKELLFFLNNPQIFIEYSNQAKEIIDGNGCNRVYNDIIK